MAPEPDGGLVPCLEQISARFGTKLVLLWEMTNQYYYQLVPDLALN
jgi:hypothetical protein